MLILYIFFFFFLQEICRPKQSKDVFLVLCGRRGRRRCGGGGVWPGRSRGRPVRGLALRRYVFQLSDVAQEHKCGICGCGQISRGSGQCGCCGHGRGERQSRSRRPTSRGRLRIAIGLRTRSAAAAAAASADERRFSAVADCHCGC